MNGGNTVEQVALPDASVLQSRFLVGLQRETRGPEQAARAGSTLGFCKCGIYEVSTLRCKKTPADISDIQLLAINVGLGGICEATTTLGK